MLQVRWKLRHVGFLAAMATGAGFAATAGAVVPQEDSAELVLVSNAASYLGVNIRDLDEHAAHALGLKTTTGVEVSAVDHDAPAGKAGLHLRDVILTVDGKAVTNAAQFRETMKAFAPNKVVALGIVRDGKPMKFAVKLADRVKLQQQSWLQHFSVSQPQLGNSFSSVASRQGGPVTDDDSDGPQEVLWGRPYRIGATLDALTPQLADYFGVKDGTGMLVKTVEPDSPAAHAGLLAGDVVLKLNDEPVATPMDWMRAMHAAQDKPVQLTIVRNKHVEVLTVAAQKTQAKLDWPALSENDRMQMQADLGALRDHINGGIALKSDEIDKVLADNAEALAAAQKDLTLPKLDLPDLATLKDEVGKMQLDLPASDVSSLQADAGLEDTIRQSLQDAGISPDGRLSPELQLDLKNDMHKAEEQIRHSVDTLSLTVPDPTPDLALPDGFGLQPY